MRLRIFITRSTDSARWKHLRQKKVLKCVLFVCLKDFPLFFSPLPKQIKDRQAKLCSNINEKIPQLPCFRKILPLSGVSRSLSIHNSYHAYQRSTQLNIRKQTTQKEGTNNSTKIVYKQQNFVFLSNLFFQFVSQANVNFKNILRWDVSDQSWKSPIFYLFTFQD